jgi:hypothetical protein
MEWHSTALDPMISEAYCWAVDVTIYTVANCVSMGHWTCTDIRGFRRYGSMSHTPISPTQFRSIGIYLYVGFKHGQWHDVGYSSKPLQTATPSTEIVVFSEVRDT